MPRIILILTYIVAAYFWGDWRNWKKYYPTILFFMICNLLYIALYSKYQLWELIPLPPLSYILFNGVLTSLALTFFHFPCVGLIYLSNYPQGKKQYLYVTMWVFINFIIELIMFYFKGITYHRGWNLAWSVVFDIVLFILLRIHFISPLKAWGLALIFLAANWLKFGFPVK